MSSEVIKWEDYFYYDETSPSFLRWCTDRGNNDLIFKPAGSKCKNGYWEVGLFSRTIKVHRIIYELFNGNIGEYYIDHIDRNKLNNKIENLRAVKHESNMRNIPKRKDNVSGVTGVSLVKSSNPKTSDYWAAYWTPLDGKRKAKYFSILKYGDNAFELAVQFRDKKIDELNKIGFGYTESHGE